MKMPLLLGLPFLLILTSCGRMPMTLGGMDRFFQEHTEVSEAQNGIWVFTYNEVEMICMTDARANRMRVMARIGPVGALGPEQLLFLHEVNFDRALDARYTISDGFLWSAYIHPLKELDYDQLHDAINQVANLQKNYGGTYSSSEVIFGGGKEAEPPSSQPRPNAPAEAEI